MYKKGISGFLFTFLMQRMTSTQKISAEFEVISVTFLSQHWLVVLRIYVALAVSQPYRDLEAGDNQSLKFKWRDQELNPGPLAPQAKSFTTRPSPLPLSQHK